MWRVEHDITINKQRYYSVWRLKIQYNSIHQFHFKIETVWSKMFRLLKLKILRKTQKIRRFFATRNFIGLLLLFSFVIYLLYTSIEYDYGIFNDASLRIFFSYAKFMNDISNFLFSIKISNYFVTDNLTNFVYVVSDLEF